MKTHKIETQEDDRMILWRRYGRVYVGTTDCGLRFEVRRHAGDRCYSLSLRTASGGEAEHSTGHQSVRAAQVSALITAAKGGCR